MAHLNARSGEVRDLKFHLNGGFTFRFLTDDTGKAKMSPHQIFLTALHAPTTTKTDKVITIAKTLDPITTRT